MLCWSHWTNLFWLRCWGLMHVKPECFHLSMPFPHNLQRVLDQPVCNMHIASYRPDIQFLCCTRVYFFVCAMISVAWGSVRQSRACNCSTFCTCTRSHLPHNVMHSSSNNSILVDHQPESHIINGLLHQYISRCGPNVIPLQLTQLPFTTDLPPKQKPQHSSASETHSSPPVL